ncbi:hypothetical protein HW555_005084, partial [Spodoptera exigua]
SPVYPSTSNDAFTSSDFTQRTRPLISSNRSRNSLPKEWKIVRKVHTVPNFDKKISIIESIVVETNRYAEHKQSKNWTDVTSQEIKAYFGILIMMGLNPLPDMELYWSTLTAGPISAIKWADSRVVTVLTTAHDPRDTMFVKPIQKDGTRKDTLIPTAIASYTLTMGGVDHFDHF